MSDFGTSLADIATSTYLDDIFPKVAALVVQPIEFLCIVYLAICGVQAYQGKFSVHDFFKRVVMISFVFATLSWGGFGRAIYDVFDTFMTDFAKAVFGSGTADTMLDAFYQGVLQIGQALLDKAGRFGVSQSLQAIGLLIINILLLAISYSILIFAKMGLAVTMSLCPIFMGFMIFPATRQWAYNWISMMLNFTFLYVLTMAVIRLSFAAFSATFNEMKNIYAATSATDLIKGYLENSADVYGLMLIMVIMIVFLLQVKSWAAALSGGAMVQTVGGMVVNTAMTLSRLAVKNPAGLLKGVKGK